MEKNLSPALTAQLAKAAGVTEAQAQKVLDVLGFSAETLQRAGVSADQLGLKDLRVSALAAGVVIAR